MSRVWLVAAIAAIGCKAQGEAFHVVELPGFSIEVPSVITAPTDAGYRAGKVFHREPPTIVAITWQAGERSAVDELPALVKVVFDEVTPGEKLTPGPSRTVSINGHVATRLDAMIGARLEATFVDIACGKRSVVVVLARARGLAAVRDRMLKSFHCKPDKREEARLDRAALIGADDPAIFEGWRRADEERSVLSITNDDLAVTFVETATPGGVDIERVRDTIPKMLGVTGATFTVDPDGRERRTIAGGERRVFDRGTLTFDGETSPAVMSLWICPGGERAIIALAVAAQDVALGTAVDFVSKIRCEQPGDAPLPIGPYVPAAPDEPGQ